MSIRIVVWSATAVLGALWMARRALDDWQWRRLQQRYPYAKRPYLQPFPLLIWKILQYFQELLIGGCVVSLWKILVQCWNMFLRPLIATKADDENETTEQPKSTAEYPEDSSDETDSLNVVVHTPPRQELYPAQARDTGDRRGTLVVEAFQKKNVLKPTVRFEEPSDKNDGCPSSVLRRRNTEDKARSAGSMKSVSFSEDASGAVSTTEHRYDPKPVNDKENTRLVLPRKSIFGKHPPGQRQIANQLEKRRIEILSRKREAPVHAQQPSEKRVSLAQFRKQRTVPKRKSDYELRREMERFNDTKKFRVNVSKQVSFAVAKAKKHVSFQLNDSTTGSQPSGTANAVSTPQAVVPHLSHPKESDTGFTLSKQATPNAQQDNKNPDGAVRTTPEIQPNSSGAVATPVPFAKSGTPHPNKANKPDVVSLGASDSQNIFAAPGSNHTPTMKNPPTSEQDSSKKTVTFAGATAVPTPAFQFSSSSAPSVGTPQTGQTQKLQTGLPPTFGTAPAPSFQFGSTPANTPTPGPVLQGTNGANSNAAVGGAPLVASNNPFEKTGGASNSAFASISTAGAPSFGSNIASAPASGPSFGGGGKPAASSLGTSTPTSQTNPFDQSATQSGPNPFGTSAPPAAEATITNPSGGAQTNPFRGNAAAPSTSSFGGSNGQPQSTTTSFGTNTPSNVTTTPHPFGNSSQPNGPNPFGNSSASNSANTFGASGQTNGSNPFATTAAGATPTFGNQISTPGFGAGTAPGAATGISFGNGTGSANNGFTMGSSGAPRSRSRARRPTRR